MKAIRQTDYNTTQRSTSNTIPLPDRPIVVIEPGRFWVALHLADLWDSRELIYFLMWRDVKVRYKQTLLGAAWAILQPLLSMFIFTLVFSKLAGMPSGDVPYQAFVYAGLVPWIFFSNAVMNSAASLIGNANLITKVYFPRMIIPSAAVGAGLVDFAIAFVLLFAMMAWYGYRVTFSLLMLPALVLLTTLLALGVGLLMSALNVKYRDVRHALPFAVQIWMFVTPIIYPSSLIPEKWRWTLALNPLAAIIEGYRSALFNLPFDWALLGVSTAVTFAILVFSSYTFRRMERSFAEIV